MVRSTAAFLGHKGGASSCPFCDHFAPTAPGLMSSYIQLWIRRKLFLWFPTPLANARSVCKILLFFLSSPLEEPQWIELQVWGVGRHECQMAEG